MFQNLFLSCEGALLTHNRHSDTILRLKVTIHVTWGQRRHYGVVVILRLDCDIRTV